MRFEEHKSLRSYNTFGLEAIARYFVEINNVKELHLLFKDPIYQNHQKLILGGGSNLLFTKDFDGLVIKNNIKGIEIIDAEQNVVKAGAGENWHEFVLFCISKGLGGIENLSLIPGCVGASPMQNIGAYGVEIKDVFHSLSAFDIQKGTQREFSKQECEFGYRESVFKRKYKDQYIIVDVSFKLSRSHKPNTSYGAINDELKKMGISEPTIRDVSNAVIAIRQSKLPDPKEIGNAGSFFKNPEVSAEKYRSLKQQFEGLVAYPLESGEYKLAAGWLIEQCGLKGFEMNGAAVHTKQALVLVNKNNTTGQNVYKLSDYVLTKVFDKFGVKLEREVNIL
jgi:UDP-N-acetylmuramate dehydrogenase